MPSSSSSSLAVSTNPFEPHTNEPRALGRRAQRLGVDVAGVAGPAVGRLARVGEDATVVPDLVLIDHVVRIAHRVDGTLSTSSGIIRRLCRSMHISRAAPAAAHEQHGRLAPPHEVGGERPSQLDLVADLGDLA